MCLFFVSPSLELNTLGQGEFLGVIDGASGAAHILFPSVRTGFSTAAGGLGDYRVSSFCTNTTRSISVF